MSTNISLKDKKFKFEPGYFDEAYYEKFYQNPGTRVNDQKSILKLAAFVAAYIRFLDIPVKNVLDLGCGVGHWKKAISAEFPKAKYLGVEYSSYLCEKYGWVKGSAADFKSKSSFDLLICQGVLQYLTDRQAAMALSNIRRLNRAFLYLECLTKGDWKNNCDIKQSDGKVYLREEKWYRSRLKGFTALGGGLFLNKSCPVSLFELEKPGNP